MTDLRDRHRAESAATRVLSAQRLMREAAEQSGHDDWGEPGFEQALTLLVDSAQATGRLSPTGSSVLRSTLLRHLRNRLYLRAYLAGHAEAARTPLRSPIVITGLPRTGTTVLQNLLAQDPRHRYLRLWEALHPVPASPDTARDEPQLVAQADRWLGRFYASAPEMQVIHPLTAHGPEECDALLQNSFASQHFDDMFEAAAYSRWFYGGELRSEYEFYALQLRVLGSSEGGRRRWILKSPGHLAHLDELRRAVPDVRIVHCHRDPVQAVTSWASLIQSVRRPNMSTVSPQEVGAQALERAQAAMTSALQSRDRAGEEFCLDVPFRRLARDPLGMVGALYEWLRMPLEPDAEAAMRRWLDANPRDRHGVHRYDPEQFGLSASRIRAALSSYVERFGPLCGGGSAT